MISAAASIRRDIAKLVRPRERIAVSEAAERYVNVRTASGGVDKWNPELTPYMVEPMNCLNSRQYDAVVFVGPAQSGKALALDTPIPTPSGWTTMGDISVGDMVMGNDGSPVEVDFVTQPMHGHDCYRVTFSDGESIVADAEHLWSVTRFNRDGTLKVPANVTIETKDMEPIFSNGNRRLFAVDNALPMQLPDRQLPVDPYVLGLWLGDGDSNHSRITTQDIELIKYIEKAGHTVEITTDTRRENSYRLIIDRKPIEGDICFRGHDKRIVGTTSTGHCLECNAQNRRNRKHGIEPDEPIYKHNGLSTRLRKLGVLSDQGCTKHIPDIYLRSSYNQRLALLQGLMDSDGTCCKTRGSCSYTSVQKPLIDGVYELLMTFGIKARVRSRQTSAYSNGQAKKGKPSWTIDFHIYDNFPVFRLDRKRVLMKPEDLAGNRAAENKRRRIANIEKTASVPVKCIRVRNESHLFLAGRGMIPTHNTQGLITNFMAYIVKCDPADFLIMQTTKGTARDFDTQVIKRAFRDSPELKNELASGSKSDNTYDKVFKSGAILFQRWPSINEISGKPLKYVLITDYDRMTQNVDGEGSPFALGQQRTAKYLSRGMTLVETSPGFEITDPKFKPRYKHEAPPCGGALSLFNMGDMRRYYVQCPECGEYYMPPPDERGLSYAHDRDLFGATLTTMTMPVKYLCHANGCLIDTKYKKEMNNTALWVPEGCWIEDGQIAGERFKSRIASFWFPGIFAAYSDPENIIEKYLKAHREYDITRSEENLKTIINVNFGAAYLPKRMVSNISAADYERRAEDLPKRQVCAGVRFLTASVDVQKNKFVVQIHGYGKYNECWLIDRFDISQSARTSHDKRLTIDPAGYVEDWLLIESDVIKKRYPLADGSGRHMGILITACDSGGKEGVTERAYTFWRHMKRKQLHNRFILVKGERPKRTANKPKIAETHPDSSSAAARKAKVVGELSLWLLNTTAIKDYIAANLERIEHGQNYIHFPNWLSNAFYEELTAENRTDDGWDKPSGARNEAFDLLCYAEAAYLVKLQKHWQKQIDWESPPLWAAEWDQNSEIYNSGSETAKASTVHAEEKTEVRAPRAARMRVRR